MPPVNWDEFAKLPGSAESNFEMLCRALVRRHYGRYGEFAARANQPGVEFHIKLRTECSLGKPGVWYGWQCRWYDLPGGRALGTTRRKKIEEAIFTSERNLPGLTHWVLWTRRPLTDGDQRWFRSRKTRLHLLLWTAAEVEEHLSGEAEILRGTYFGELVLTPTALSDLHIQAVAPIKRRWQPEVHQPVRAERNLRCMLGELASWDHLRVITEQLVNDAHQVEADIQRLSEPFVGPVTEVTEYARSTAAFLTAAYSGLDRGDLDLLRLLIDHRPAPPDHALSGLPHQLRATRQPAALSVTNTLASARQALRVVSDIGTALTSRIVAVLADAGCGKTELAAQLTAPVGDRPAGILLHGRELHARQNLDDFARRVVIQGNQVRSMEALIGAVDAAGQRARRRLPIVIDGLNEAEDPRDWKGPLAALTEILHRYPYVLVVCTLRTAFADEALPEGIKRRKIPGFGRDTTDAIRRYFAHYRINPADADWPWKLLNHPLTLRLFCEVTNPSRAQEVGVEAMPGSLTTLFDKYLDQAAKRVAELAPRTSRFYEADVRSALTLIGTELWEKKARDLDLQPLRKQLRDERRTWNESLIRALEQEGVLLRVPGDRRTGNHIAVVYDLLAGHLVADSLLDAHGRGHLGALLSKPATVAALNEATPRQHPLGGDILYALVGLAPRRFHGQQLWPLLREPLRGRALRKAADLDGAYLDAETVTELATLAAAPATATDGLYDRLHCTRGSENHPLNAEFLDRVLRPMAVAQRDRHWTEWVRRNEEWLMTDLRRLTDRWQSNFPRTMSDRLRARWVMWLLTSTIRNFRDQATCALYWFGRGDPQALFEMALDSLAVNDPYVPERVLGASYGVIMAHQLEDPGFVSFLKPYLEGLHDALTGNTAASPTSHWLIRLHAQGSFDLARAYHNIAVPAGLATNGQLPFAPGPTVTPLAASDPGAEAVRQTLDMDFKNYTLGRLTTGRRNYDMNHAGHQDVVAHVCGMIWALGWRDSLFAVIDKDISTNRFRAVEQQTDRYGKKYGWIGFYTYAGQLADAGQLPRERLSDLGIDPSFPDPPLPAPVSLPAWAKTSPKDNRRWLRDGKVDVSDEFFFRSEIDGQPGPWIAAHAELVTKDQAPGREVFGRLQALLVPTEHADRFTGVLGTRVHPGGWWLPEVPNDHYTFAGEIPWSVQFGRIDGDEEPYRKFVEVDDDTEVDVEILAHYYAWESYHSSLNRAGGAIVPSRLFSNTFDLRGVPQSFGQKAPDGTWAAMSFSAPDGFDGHLLYLREDLVYKYAAGRKLIWFIWGERRLELQSDSSPRWLIDICQSGQDVWRIVRRGEELSPLFATIARPQGRRVNRRRRSRS